MALSSHLGNLSEDFIPILVRKTEYNRWSKNMKHPLLIKTKMPNRVYITFIEGIEVTPAAVRRNVREA